MPKPRRNLLATAEETLHPPDKLLPDQTIARVVSAAGNNLYHVEAPSNKPLLVELPARFRSTIWIKRGSYVLVETTALAERDNKIDGQISNIVRSEKDWRKMPYWPAEFVKKKSYADEDEDDESTVGQMPPSGSDDEA